MPRNAHDLEWLGLELAPGALGAIMAVQARHVAPTGTLYGGAAVAVVTALLEEATGWDAVWVTVQFAATCTIGDLLDLRVTVPAAGHRTAQARVVATKGGAEVFAAVGAARRDGGAGVDVRQWGTPGPVPAPEASPTLVSLAGLETVDFAREAAHLEGTDLRVAAQDRPAGRLSLWVRPSASGRTSAAVLGWYADLLGMVLMASTGATGATSLDNTVRFGPLADPLDAWFLIEMHLGAAHDGLGHGRADLWSPGGTLLAAASQTCVLRGLPG